MPVIAVPSGGQKVAFWSASRINQWFVSVCVEFLRYSYRPDSNPRLRKYNRNILISDFVRSQLTIQVAMRDMGEAQIWEKEKLIRVFQVATA
jgi:hypothetical protein